MGVAGLVVLVGAALEGVFEGCQGNGAGPVGVGRGRRGAGGELQGGEHAASIAAGHVHQVVPRLRFQRDLQAAKAALLIRERAVEQRGHLLLSKRVQSVDPGPGEQRADDLEGGVLGSGADEDDGAILDVGEHGVLLRLVEAVDLIDEEDGALTGLLQAVTGLLDRPCAGRQPLRRRR